MDNNHWPDLPQCQRPQHAYGLLEIRAGEVAEEDLDTMEPEDLEGMPREGEVRHSMLARVDLFTGELHTEEYLSRDAYDWGIDTIVFRPYRGSVEVDVEEGARSAFLIDDHDLADVHQAWREYLANCQNQTLEDNTPQVAPGRTGPRL